MSVGMLDYTTLFTVYRDHTSVVNTLWGIFQVVSLALLGFVYKEQHLRTNGFALVALSAAFLVFAMGNQAAMTRSQRVLVAVVSQMSEQAPGVVPETSGVKAVLAAHRARSLGDMRRDHSAFMIGVVLIIWVPFVAGRWRVRIPAKKVRKRPLNNRTSH